jgi:hypothetical protein
MPRSSTALAITLSASPGIISHCAARSAAASVRSEADDRIRSLRNRLEEGSWLLLVESSPGQEIPWLMIQQAGPQAVVRLGEG